MAQRILPRGSRGYRALAVVAIAVSLVVANATAGSHTHADAADSPAACLVCASAHQAQLATDCGTASLFAGSAVACTPAHLGFRIGQRPMAVSPHHTRAPPATLSLL